MTSAISHQDLSDLIGRVYDCTLDPSRWEPPLDAIRSLLGCRTGQLLLADLRQRRILIQKTLGMEAQLIELVSKHIPEITQLIEGQLDGGLSIDEPMVVSRLTTPEYRAASPYFQENAR